MSEVNLYSLSIDELKEQARILGIVVRGNVSAETLRNKIRSAIEIEPPADQKVKTEDLGRKKDWITIVIAEDENDTQPAFVGVNGKSYRIRRGEPVPVPPEVVRVLRDAQQVVVNPKDGSSKKVPTYPFRIES